MNQYEDAPKLAAQFLCDGGTVELVDGDACEVNEVWIDEVLKNVNRLLKEKLGLDRDPKVCKILETQEKIPK